MVISCEIKIHYVILLVDGSHHCTCTNLLIIHEYLCHHFYKILRCSTQAKWHIGLIASRWYKDDIIDGNNDIWQQSPITLCINSNQEQNNDQYLVYKFDYIKQIRGAEFYNQNLREINCIRRKYGKVHGLMWKALNAAIATNSYDEFIGICHGFISDKQAILESGQNIEEIDFNIKNPIITTRKGRPAGKAKSCIEIQDQHARKWWHLQPLDDNNQMSNNNASGSNNNEKDKRKTCQNCGEKGHNRITCKFISQNM